ncbi:Hypothetical predicted protein [Xyrichtys novacula]|uniref:Uncharacterized protein n=1 Tax=Xyrichtys novacula TaxID=13765 RepID=A0AAV1HPI0_XYRNO|nr:Hypothetical predicted protein [Xyrichtys novacula]
MRVRPGGVNDHFVSVSLLLAGNPQGANCREGAGLCFCECVRRAGYDSVFVGRGLAPRGGLPVFSGVQEDSPCSVAFRRTPRVRWRSGGLPVFGGVQEDSPCSVAFRRTPRVRWRSGGLPVLGGVLERRRGPDVFQRLRGGC